MSERMTTENQVPVSLPEEIEVMLAVGGLSPAQRSTFERAAKRITELEASTIHAKYVSAMGLIKACKPYLKDGETPAECIQRNRSDVGSVMSLLAKEKFRIEAALNEVTVFADGTRCECNDCYACGLKRMAQNVSKALTGGSDE